MKTNYAGIDYGMGKSNIGPNGIRFGAIHQNSLNGDELATIFDNAEDLTFKQYIAEAKSKLKDALSDYFSDVKYGAKQSKLDIAVEDAFDAIEDGLNEGYEAQDPSILYKRDGYTIQNTLDADLMILDSPYYTFAQFCSPCLPGAGNLDCPLEEQPETNRTYCLGPEWFDGNPPYPVYKVSDNQLVPSRDDGKGL